MYDCVARRAVLRATFDLCSELRFEKPVELRRQKENRLKIGELRSCNVGLKFKSLQILYRTDSETARAISTKALILQALKF